MSALFSLRLLAQILLIASFSAGGIMGASACPSPIGSVQEDVVDSQNVTGTLKEGYKPINPNYYKPAPSKAQPGSKPKRAFD